MNAIQHVASANPTFGLHDDAGIPMETLKIDAYPGGYLGVYHYRLADHYVVRLATSIDLVHWAFRTQLDVDASQPTLASLSDGTYLLAVEADNAGRPGPGRRWLRFRHYAGRDALLSGRADRIFDAPHTLTAANRGAEGTPNIYSAVLRPGIGRSRIEVGFHFLEAGVDREALGTLTNFTSWVTRRNGSLDAALIKIGMAGKHGDRDSVMAGSTIDTLVESQNGRDKLWRVALFDPRTSMIHPLRIETPAGSTSFANPTVTYAPLPSGEPGIVITLYVPRTGSAVGEVGELLYYRSLPGYPEATQ